MDDERRRRFRDWFRATYGDKDDARARFMSDSAERGDPPLSKGRVAQLFDDKQPFGERAAAMLGKRFGLGDYFLKEDLPSELPAMTRRNVRRVWVVGQTMGGMPERVWTDGDQPIGSTDRFAEVATTDELAFACRVVGDSMVPRYMPGEYALVEPGTYPELEDDVLVRLVTGETLLKRLLSRRGGLRLGSYNSPEVLSFEAHEVSWVYYVAHPIPARRISDRVDLSVTGDEDPDTIYPDLPDSTDNYLGGPSSGFGELPAPTPAKKTGKSS